jgi:ABC-type multidrug transport system fused ATPase/permease subunit
MMLAAAGAAMRPIAVLNNTLNEAAAAAVRIDEVLKLPVESNARGQRDRDLPILARHRQSVRFENVSYAYPDAPQDAVHGIDLEVRFGQTVAVVGPNGSGKSTLLYMLPRLIDPRDGRITIDGSDICTVSLLAPCRCAACASNWRW